MSDIERRRDIRPDWRTELLAVLFAMGIALAIALGPGLIRIALGDTP